MSDKTPPLFNNTQHFIEEVLFGTLGWKIHDTKLVLCSSDGRILKESELEVEYQYDLIKKFDRINIRLDAIPKLINRMIFKIKEDKWKSVRESLNDPMLIHESERELDKLVKIIVPDTDEERCQRGLDHTRNKLKYIILNFYKQIKHKVINEEDLDYPVVPIFYGGQGLAKSKLVKYLTDFFDPFVKKMNVQQITDFDRFYKFLRDKMVIRIDELDGADKSPLNILKSLITDNEIVAKRYHSQNPIEEYCFATFVITSNKRSFKVFRDPSGNRRWADFEIYSEVDLDKFGDVKLDVLIKGIPLSDTPEERQRMRTLSEKYLIPDQLEYRHQDDVDEFVEDLQVIINFEDIRRNTFISKDELFKDFQSFRKKRRKTSNNLLTVSHFWASLKDVLKTVDVDSKTLNKFIDTNRKIGQKSKRGIMLDIETYNKRKNEILEIDSEFDYYK